MAHYESRLKRLLEAVDAFLRAAERGTSSGIGSNNRAISLPILGKVLHDNVVGKMTELRQRRWPVLMIASVAGLPLVLHRMVLGAEGAMLAEALQVEHRMIHWLAAAAVLALSLRCIGRGGETQENVAKGGSGSIPGTMSGGLTAFQTVANDVQDFWWQYIGLPLHFRATRVAGFVKGLVQNSIFVFWESTRLAPKRFGWWLKRCAEQKRGDVKDSLDLTAKEMSQVESVARFSDCAAAVVGNSGPCSSRIRGIIPDVFLLHFGALLGETHCASALKSVDRLKDLGTCRGLFGEAEEAGWIDRPWKKPVQKSKPGLSFTLQKKYIRKGLFLYRTSAVIENAAIEDFCHFNLSMEERKKWDWTVADFSYLEDNPGIGCDERSGFVSLESILPGPLANREYVYARRVWKRPDGGCYAVCVSTPHPQVPRPRGRNVRVDEYATAFVVRPTKSLQGRSTPAVEVASLYFDSPKMRSIAFNLAMNSGMWAAIQSLEENFRKCDFRVGNIPLPKKPILLHSDRRQRRRAVLKGVRGIASGACKVAVVVAIASFTTGRPKLR